MTNTDFLVNSFNTLYPHAWWMGCAPSCYYLHKWLWHCPDMWAIYLKPWQISQTRVELCISLFWLLLKKNLTVIHIFIHAHGLKNILYMLLKKNKSRPIWDGFRIPHITAQITEIVWFCFTNYTSVVRLLFKKTIEINQLQP